MGLSSMQFENWATLSPVTCYLSSSAKFKEKYELRIFNPFGELKGNRLVWRRKELAQLQLLY